ncbi:MAG: glycosyltransferase family 9 protein [Spirochaetes bacterium]|nr:glycosyltransferase family 9 protein [Spirochaetota bacterium]
MKVLIIRLSSFGDILFTTPSIRALYKKHKNIQIDILIYSRFIKAVSENPLLNKVHTLPKREIGSLFKKFKILSAFKKLITFLKALRKTKYDYIIDMHNVTDSALLALIAKGKYRIGNKSQLLSLFFTKRCSFNEDNYSANMHTAQSNLEYLREAGCIAEKDILSKPKLEFYIPKEDKRFITQYIKKNNLTGKKLAGINPCSSYDYKRWCEEGFAKTADYLHKIFKFTILIFGTPGEKAVVESVQRKMKCSSIDTSELTLFQAFELIRRLDFFVTNNTGPVHIAAAFDTPQVAVFGPTNYLKYYPLSDKAITLYDDISCEELRKRKASKNCFDNLDIKTVKKTCKKIFNNFINEEGKK